MKKVLLLIILIFGIQLVNAQKKYDKLWKEVEQFELQGKFKSASQVVDKILKNAKRTNKSAQIIKGFIYKSKFILLLEEESQHQIVSEIEHAIESSEFPTNAILESIYAGYLEQYLERNRYNIRKSPLVKTLILSKDFEKWDINTFVSQVVMHYRRSLELSEELKQISIKDFGSILTESKTSYKFRPTLYDFLAHRALNFYKKDQWSVIRPKERFVISDLIVFEATHKFEKERFYTIDSIYSNRNVLKLYQQLETFHIKLDTVAYIDIVLKRLKFSRLNASIENKGRLYLNALYRLSRNFKTHESSSIINYHLANFYFEESNNFNAKADSVLKEYRIKSLKICKDVLKKYPNSNGGLLCKILKNKIEEKDLEIKCEKYIIPEKPFLSRVKFKSVDSLYMLAYRIPHDYFGNKSFNLKDSLALEIVEMSKPISSQFYKLQPKKDFYEYSTEIMFPKLSIGSYLIVATNKEHVNSLDQIYSYDMITVTNLSMLSIDKGENLVLRFLDRENGSPIEDVNVLALNTKGFIKRGKTNDQGEFYIRKNKKFQSNIRLVAGQLGDTILKYDYRINSFYGSIGDEHTAKMLLYLDRSIYRPGQTLYFKGLLVEKKKGELKVVPNVYTSVIINDANYQELKEYRLKTNEFGSVSGEFKIPTNVLMGEFTIEMDEDYNEEGKDDPYWEKVDDVEYSDVTFSVEEYKRPKFEVLFDDVTDNYKIGDSINISGEAKAFLGSNISNAKVSYSIFRKKPLRLQNIYYYHIDNQCVKTGEVKTNDQGEFYINFVSSPDSLLTKKDKPVFVYSIKVDVTDINGETRSAEKTVKLGFHNLKLGVDIEPKLNSSQKQNIQINTKNLNDQTVFANVKLSIYKLLEQQRAFRKKPWEVVEIKSIPKERFRKLFPYEIYDASDLQKSRIKKALVFSKNLNTSNVISVPLDSISYWKPGTYLLEARAIDTFKDTVFQKRQFEIYHPEDNQVSNNKLFDYEVINSEFRKDKFATIKLKTAVNNLNITLEGYYKEKEIFKKTISIEKGSTLVKVPISQKYKKKVSFNISFIKYNSLYSKQFSIDLPEKEKELIIETISFRNKLVPDQKETWRFKITNSNNKNAQAEVLASMYDTSLDQFKEHYWHNNIRFDDDNYSYTPSIQDHDFFDTTTFNSLKYNTGHNIISVVKNYHKLRWFGFNFGEIEYVNRRYLDALSQKETYPSDTYVEGNISGIVTDSQGYPVHGVTVLVKGTAIGVVTDLNGFYSINAAIGSELVYSSLGFKTEFVTVNTSGVLNIVLSENFSALEAVAINAGYYNTTQMRSTGSISRISTKKFNLSQAIRNKLGGKISGVNITQNKGVSGGAYHIQIRGQNFTPSNSNEQTLFIIDGVPVDLSDKNLLGVQFSLDDIHDIDVLRGGTASAIYGSRGSNGVVIITTKKSISELTQVETRNDLKETAFFFPHLTTNKQGEIIFSFDSPQALTKWKFMLLAHNKNFESSILQKTAFTQKDLNVIPNVPRFLREKDSITISAKISNLTNEPISGISLLQLFDATTMTPLEGSIINLEHSKNFSVHPKGNVSVKWEIKVPEGVSALQYKIVAKSATHSDGETNVLPVLSNRILVTEARPLWVSSGKTKEVTFEKLKNLDSTSLKNHRFTLEYTSNPAWLAIKSLPYLMEFPYECAEQTFARFYSNALASTVVNQNPEIREVFNSWKKESSLESEFEKNERLKSILISESPWARDAMGDKENKSRLANLFDEESVKDQQLQMLSKLKDLQLSSGGFPWFSGGNENNFITRHIVAGFGHLQKVNNENGYDKRIERILEKSIIYLDSEFVKNYHESIHVSIDSKIVHYLYSRSFFLETNPVSDKVKKIMTIYTQKCKESWLTQSLYDKGMIALFLYRIKEIQIAETILEALKEQAIYSEEEGMYWKENSSSWHWNKAPIETQALLIEAFGEIKNENKIIDQLKQWLLKKKQTNKWGSTKATTEAIYALLINGSDWLSVSDNTVITIGDQKIKTAKLEPTKKEAGTGYMKVNWTEEEISSSMSQIKVKNKGEVTGSGAIYWQYFEDIDKVMPSENTPLRIKKRLFVKKITENGEELLPVKSEVSIKLGDIVTVRIEVVTKNNMEFVHLKDLRASGLEPIDVLSEYKWQNGLSYYQSTKDVATHFFFDELPKGTYIFEYDLRASNNGSFSNGISIIQSMYAPEFINRSKETRIRIVE